MNANAKKAKRWRGRVRVFLEDGRHRIEFMEKPPLWMVLERHGHITFTPLPRRKGGKRT